MRAGAVTLASLVVLAGQSGCDAGCSNETVSSQGSPSGAYKAVVFSRNCGATTGFNTQLSILKASEAPNSSGNALILDATIPLVIRWSSETRVSVEGANGAKHFKQERSVSGIEVSYE
jgi:hypothetical protein